MNKKDVPRPIPLITVIQSVFLTASFFVQNDLLTYASSCAFGFMMSVIPVVMMILSILLRVLHTAPELLLRYISDEDFLGGLFSVERMLASLESMEHTGLFEIVVGVSLFWMAKRFFTSVMTSMSCIFHRYASERPMILTLFSLAGEVLIVVVISALIAVIVTAESLLGTSVFASFVPPVMQRLLGILLSFVPGVLLFLFITVCYRAGARTSPPLSLCMIGSLFCTVSFGVVRLVFSLFLDMNKYNLIYGVLSNTIVVLLEVFIFFLLFLFFAQYLFVLQFFDDLLLAELYLLPDRDTMEPLPVLRRLLFINPMRLTAKTENVFYCAPDSVIYHAGDISDDVFYIAEGTVELSRLNHIRFYERGDFFGEVSVLLLEPRRTTARAVTAVQLIRIDKNVFMRMTQSNPEVSKKALAQITGFVPRR